MSLQERRKLVENYDKKMTNAHSNKADGTSVHSTFTEKASQPKKPDEVRTLNIPANKLTYPTDGSDPLMNQHAEVRKQTTNQSCRYPTTSYSETNG